MPRPPLRLLAAAVLMCACQNTVEPGRDVGGAIDGSAERDAPPTGMDGATDAGTSPADAASMSPDGTSVDAGVSRDAAPPRPSTGCGTPRTSGYTCSSMMIGGVARQYCVMVPTTYDASRPMPVRYSLHGCGGSISMTGSADDGPFIMVYPKSVASCWEQSTSSTDAMFIQAIESDLEQTHCVDRDRIFADGYSSGGFMATILACARFAGVRAAATAGGASNCREPMALWQYHGMMDTTVPYASYGPVVRDLMIRANGCSSTTRPVPGASACVEYEGCRERTIWCTDDGGHRWPSWGRQAAGDFFLSY